MGAGKWPRSLELPKAHQGQIFDFVPVFVSREFEVGSKWELKKFI